MSSSGWRSHGVLAWTRHDGPGPAPSPAPRPLMLTLAAALSVVYAGMLFTDALCPEHRAWVQGIAGISFIAGVAAAVALIRGWAGGGLLAVLTATGGVAIGMFDAAHDPTRGRVIALLFAAIVVVALAAWAANLRLRRWDRGELASATTTLPAYDDAPVAAENSASPPAPRATQPSDEDVPAPHRM